MIDGLHFKCNSCKKFKKIKDTNNRIGLPTLCNDCLKLGNSVDNLSGGQDIGVNDEVVKQSFTPHKEI